MGAYDKDLYIILGNRLRNLRKEKGYSLEFVANKIGMTKKTIQRYELGEQRISIEKLSMLCDIYMYNIDILNAEVKKELDALSKKTFNSQFGTDQELIDFFHDQPELLEMYRGIQQSDSLQLLFDSTKDLSPEDLKPVLEYIYTIRKAKGLE